MAAPSRQELLQEYVEAGHFERLLLQQTLNTMTVFLVSTGGALTVFKSLDPGLRDLRVLTAIFGLVLACAFLLAAERMAYRSSAIQRRAREIELVLGLRLREALGGAGPAAARCRQVTATSFRAIYVAVALVWTYAGVRAMYVGPA